MDIYMDIFGYMYINVRTLSEPHGGGAHPLVPKFVEEREPRDVVHVAESLLINIFC